MIYKRPWGYFIKFIDTGKMWIKFLDVSGRTSLQSHALRDEYFIGFYKVKRGEKHRLNRGKYLELAIGVTKESDIKRYEDDYGRYRVVATSGYFNPLHRGHLRLLHEAKKLGDYLIVIVNNDLQVDIKGSKKFMDAEHRAEIIRNLKCVDEVVISIDTDGTVCKTLQKIKPNIFAKGGDSNKENVPEEKMCSQNNIKVIYGVGGNKIESSSNLLKNI